MAKLADLQLATGARKTFTFKHTKLDGSQRDVTVEIRVLSKIELDAARKDALTTVKDLNEKLRDGRTYDEMLAEARTIEILAKALMDPEKPAEPWATPMELAQTLHPGAIALLDRAYAEHQEECGPFVRDLTPEQFDAVVEEMAKEASADPLALFATPLRNACITTMARELVLLRIERSSHGSQSPEQPSETAGVDPFVAETVRDHTAMINRLTDEVASLRVRLMHIEAASSPADKWATEQLAVVETIAPTT